MKKILNNKINNKAVSHVLGFILTFSLASMVVATTLYTSTVLVDRSKRDAAEMEALSLANRVAGAVMEAAKMKQWYPNGEYSKTLDIPNDLAGYRYYVEVSGDSIWVKTTGGEVEVEAPNYNLETTGVCVSGRVDGSKGFMEVYCNKTEYVYKFDFGKQTSPGEVGYSRITDSCDNSNWSDVYSDWPYRAPIYLWNPNSESLQNFQLQLTLDETSFCYPHANSNGSDIRFETIDGTVCQYWIEKWNDALGVSTIWIKIPSLDANSGTILYIYYGNSSAKSASDGDATFDFFEDFSDSNLDDWLIKSNSNVSVDDGLLVMDDVSSIVTKSKTLPSRGVLETKVKSVGEVREADIFIRCQDQGNHYNSGYVFSSGNFSDPLKNISFLKDNSVVLSNTSDHRSMINDEWFRLRYIFDDILNVGARYLYNDSILYDYTYFGDSTYTSGGYFGLCTPSTGDFISYFDWIYLRKDSDDPIKMTLGGENSIFYTWSEISILNGSTYNHPGSYLYGDFVWSEEGDIFSVILPDEGLYTASFVVGDRTKGNMDMAIDVNPEPILGGSELNDIKVSAGGFGEYYYWGWFVFNNSEGSLDLGFSDGGLGDLYWTINMLTIERGIRGVKIR